MAVLHLYKNRMNGQKVSYNTCTYDFASATEDTDYVRASTAVIQQGAKCPWSWQYPLDPTKTVKTMAVSITLAGMNYFNGLKDPAQAPLMSNPWGSANGGSNIVMETYTGSTAPSDWTVHWRDKYFTLNQQAYVGDLGPEVYNFYQSVSSSTYNPNETYYYVDETQSKPIQYAWWTKTGNYFGAATGWIPATNFGYLQAVQKTSAPAQLYHESVQGAPEPLWWTVGGVSGTQVGYHSWVFNTISSTMASDNMDVHDTPEFSPVLLDFISYEYDDDIYIGFVSIKFGADGVPLEAKISAISEEFWKDENGTSYEGPISLPGGGDGEYNDQDDQKGKKGSITAYSFGSIAPGAPGYKVVKGKIGALDNMLDKYIQYIKSNPSTGWLRNLTTDPKGAMELFQSGIISVYKVPIEPSGSGSPIAQWQVAGDVYALDEGWALTHTLERYSYLDCGAISLARWHDSFLDYDPYTQVSIFLPFIGTFELPVSDIMYGTLYLEYYQDNLNGDLVARLSCYNGAFPNAHIQNVGLSPYWHLIGEFAGNGLMQVPVSASVNTMGIYGAWSAVKSGIQAGRKFAGENSIINLGSNLQRQNSPSSVYDKAVQEAKDFGGELFGDEPGLSRDALEKVMRATVLNRWGSAGKMIGKSIPLLVGGTKTAIELANAKPTATSILSTYTGNSGYMGTLTPYIRIVRTLYDEPATQGHDKAYPSNVSFRLADLPKDTFNICAGTMSLDDGTFPLSATQAEKQAITSILTSGFYR